MNTKIRSFKSHTLFNQSTTFAFLLLMLFCLWSLPASSANGVNVDTRANVAIHGYDPVAYFKQKKPRKGKAQFTVEYNGNRWALSNAANKKAFLKNPEMYIPQYGGFCAYAASKNAIANIDPTAWTIHNNKLYLNNTFGVKTLWNLSRDSHIKSADKNWPALRKQVPDKK